MNSEDKESIFGLLCASFQFLLLNPVMWGIYAAIALYVWVRYSV